MSVDQPSLTPRFVMSGRRVSGRRNTGGSCAQFVGSLGGIFDGLAAAIHFLVPGDGEVRGLIDYLVAETDQKRWLYKRICLAFVFILETTT